VVDALLEEKLHVVKEHQRRRVEAMTPAAFKKTLA